VTLTTAIETRRLTMVDSLLCRCFTATVCIVEVRRGSEAARSRGSKSTTWVAIFLQYKCIESSSARERPLPNVRDFMNSRFRGKTPSIFTERSSWRKNPNPYLQPVYGTTPSTSAIFHPSPSSELHPFTM
jgi:hypothetical protein